MRLTKTNESICALAPFCKKAGDVAVCNDKCAPFISVNSRYSNAGIPKDYERVYLNNSPARETQSEIYGLLNTYIKTFSDENVRIKNVYLYSQSPGTGKTTTAMALLNEYIRRRFLMYAKGKKHVPEILALNCDINALQSKYNMSSMSNNDEAMGEIMDAIKKYQTVEFLVMDDVGVRSATESFRSLIHAIINERVTNGRPTIFTSNVRMSDLDTIFDSRLYDRVRDQTVELTFVGASKRGRR